LVLECLVNFAVPSGSALPRLRFTGEGRRPPSFELLFVERIIGAEIDEPTVLGASEHPVSQPA
jgi:hypothetical protein